MAQETPVPQPTSPAPAAEPVVPVQEAPPVPTEEKPVETSEKPVKEKGKMKWLYILVIVMAVLALALVSYIVYTEIFKEDEVGTTEESDDMEDQDTDTDLDIEEEVATTEAFTGDYVSAMLPLGWSIVEYEDGLGTNMVTEGVDFTGLTGVEFLNEESDMVFKFYAVYGIGGTDACDDYYQFDDYNEDNYNEVVASSVDFGITTTLIDYTDVEYTEYDFLGLRIRRVEKMFFQDIVDGDTFFEPACNISYGVWNLEGLAFNDGTMDSSAYMWDVADDATDEELLLLDDILGSMEAI